MRTHTLPALLAVACCTGAALAQPATKKLIEYGWDVPAPSYVADHIREMEQRPFDGRGLGNSDSVCNVQRGGLESGHYVFGVDDLPNQDSRGSAAERARQEEDGPAFGEPMDDTKGSW